MHAHPYEPNLAQEWDAFCTRAPMTTFLHTRRFLGYHGDRFRDMSVVLLDDRDELIGAFPAAEDPADEQCVVSHPGITYGGLIHNGRLGGARALDALDALVRHYRSRGYRRLHYKVVPHIYHASPAADDLYALFRLGAVRRRCDLSCAVDLDRPTLLSGRRKRGLRKALSAGIDLYRGHENAEAFWNVLEGTLERKHNTRPVHTSEEITRLHGLFPANIEFVTAQSLGDVIAGTVLFHSARVTHAQYIAAAEAGESCGALDLLLHECIASARADGKRYFDFGISNEDEGRRLNEGLYRYKSEFGGGGVVHEFYELLLDQA